MTAVRSLRGRPAGDGLGLTGELLACLADELV